MLPRYALDQLPEALADLGSEANVDVWWWPYDSLCDWNNIRLKLTPEEQSQATSFHFGKDAISFIAGRLLRRMVVSAYTTIPARDLNFAVGPNGKPYLASSGIVFNLANTDDLVVLAISRGCSSVGIDAEPVTSLIEPEAAALFCSLAERDILSGLPASEMQSLLLSYWVLKESFLKATGTGLAAAPDELNVRLERSTNAIHFDDQATGGEANWHHHLLQGPDGHLIAISAQSDRARLVLRQRKFALLPDRQ